MLLSVLFYAGCMAGSRGRQILISTEAALFCGCNMELSILIVQIAEDLTK